MYVGTRNCCRPVCPPGSSSIVEPVNRIGALTVALKPPSDVTRFRALTPLGALASGCWASTGATTATSSATTRASENLITMDPPCAVWVSLSDPTRDALDEAVEEEVVENRHWQADEQGRPHDRAPVVDVAEDQVGRHPHRHRLLVAGRDEGEPVEEVLHRQREGEDDGGQHPGQADRHDETQECSGLAAAVHPRRLLDLHRDRLEEAHHQPRAERDRERRVDEDERPRSEEHTSEL